MTLELTTATQRFCYTHKQQRIKTGVFHLLETMKWDGYHSAENIKHIHSIPPTWTPDYAKPLQLL